MSQAFDQSALLLNCFYSDCKYNNIMMDAKDLYLHPPHPVAHNMRRDFSGPVKHTTRTRRPVKYYLIDFGLSRRYNPEDMPPLEPPPWGGDRTVPEFLKSDEPCNPFPVDVYFLGNVVRQNFIEVCLGFLHVYCTLMFFREMFLFRQSEVSNSLRTLWPIWCKMTHRNDPPWMKSFPALTRLEMD
jgi:hypothetical protein